MMDWDPCLTLEAQGGIFHPLCPWQSGCWDGAKHAPFRGQPGLEMSSRTLQEFSFISGGAIFLCLVSPQLAPGTWWTWPCDTSCQTSPFSRDRCLAGWSTQKDPGAVC